MTLDAECPQYGLAVHKGYAVADHMDALVAYGTSPCHRPTFHLVVPREGEEFH